MVHAIIADPHPFPGLQAPPPLPATWLRGDALWKHRWRPIWLRSAWPNAELAGWPDFSLWAILPPMLALCS